MAENSKNLYCQTESECTLKVEKIGGSRKKKKCEDMFGDFLKFRMVSTKSYHFFDNDIYILGGFLEALKFSRLWLGNANCVNLLNPAKMLCPVFNCCDDRNLKRFNDFVYILHHLIKHKVKNDIAATKLVDRFHFVEKWFEANKFSSLEDSIAAIESSNDGGKSLSLGTINLFRPSAEDTFKGKQYLMVESAVQNYILGDPNALLNINAPVTSFFVTASTSYSKGGREVGVSSKPAQNNKPSHSNKENKESSSAKEKLTSSKPGCSGQKASSSSSSSFSSATQVKKNDGSDGGKKKAKKKRIEAPVKKSGDAGAVKQKRDIGSST